MTHTKLVAPDRPLVIPQALAFEIGLEAALVLQQIHYWQERGEIRADGKKWFYKAYRQWEAELPLSSRAIRTAISKLKELGLICVEKLSAKNWYQANWYRICSESVKALWLSICPKRSHPSDQCDRMDAIAPDTSIYTETTPQESTSTHTPPQPPTPIELTEAEKELRECRINPAAVRRELLKWFANFKGAIARVKEAQSQDWCKNPTGLFLKSLKLGLKPDSPDFSRERFEIPEPPAGLEDWAIAHSDQIQDFFYSSITKCWRVVCMNGSQADAVDAMRGRDG